MIRLGWARVFAAFVALFLLSCSRGDAPKTQTADAPAAKTATTKQAFTTGSDFTPTDLEVVTDHVVSVAQTFVAPVDGARLTGFHFAELGWNNVAAYYIVEWDDEAEQPIGDPSDATTYLWHAGDFGPNGETASAHDGEFLSAGPDLRLQAGVTYAFILTMIDADFTKEPDLQITSALGGRDQNGLIGNMFLGSYPNGQEPWGYYFVPDRNPPEMAVTFSWQYPTQTLPDQGSTSSDYGEPFDVTAEVVAPSREKYLAGEAVRFVPTLINLTQTAKTDLVNANGLPYARVTFNGLQVTDEDGLAIFTFFDGDGDYALSENALTHRIDYGTSNLALTAAPTQANTGQTVAYTATVTPGKKSVLAPRGSVTFKDSVTGATADVPLTVLEDDFTSVAMWNKAFTDAGPHTVTATYTPLPLTYLTSQDNLVIDIRSTKTSLALATSGTPSVVGTTVTFTSTLSAATLPPNGHGYSIHFHGQGANTGIVLDGDSPLVDGKATYVPNGLPPDTYSVSSSFAGDTAYDPSTSNTVMQTVVQDGVVISGTDTPAETSTFGQPVSYDFMVASTGPGGTPTGSYRIFDGNTQIIDKTPLPSNGKVGPITLNDLAAGSHTIRFFYDGDTNHAATNAGFPHFVTKTDSTVTPSDSGDSQFGQPFTVKAVVTQVGTIAPTGSIAFSENGTDLGTGSAPSATLSLSTLAVGSHTISIRYTGDTNYNPKDAFVVHNVVQASTNTTIMSVSNPSSAGSPVTITMIVAPALATTAKPTGTVTLFEGTKPLGSGSIDDAGHFATSVLLPVGNHTLHAVYAGDASFGGSHSGDLVQRVDRATTQMQVTTSESPTQFGTAVVFFAHIPNVNGTHATGSVTFIADNANVLGTSNITNDYAIITTSALATGTHVITATYAGDANFLAASGSVAQVVDKATTTTTLAVAPSPAVFGQATTLSATVTGTTTGIVTFREGGTTLGTAAVIGGKASLDRSSWAVGTHALSASFAADADHLGSTGTSSLVVAKANSALTLTSSINPAHAGLPVSFTAIAQAVAPGGGIPSGDIVFKDGATTIGTVTIGAGGVATLTTSTLAEGPHDVTASLAASASFNASTSAIVHQTISAAAVTVAVTATPDHVTFGNDVLFSVTVTSTLPVNGTSVTVTEGGTPLCTVTLDNAGNGTCTSSALHAGTHSVSALVGGASGSASVVVDKAASTISVTSSKNPASAGDEVTLTATVGNGATGDVEVFLGTTSLGKVGLTNGSVTVTKTLSAAGSFDITAKYVGDVDHAAATSAVLTQVVNGSTGADAGTDAGGTDAGNNTGTSSSSSSSSSSSGSAVPPPTADAGGSSGGLGAIPIANPNTNDDSCSTTAPGTGGSAVFGLGIVLAGLAARRRRRS